MEIKKAIEIFDLNLLHAGSHMPPDVKDALKLGKEALEREKQNRDNPDFVMVGLLPGETSTPSKES